MVHMSSAYAVLRICVARTIRGPEDMQLLHDKLTQLVPDGTDGLATVCRIGIRMAKGVVLPKAAGHPVL